jgi:hypothetical protein
VAQMARWIQSGKRKYQSTRVVDAPRHKRSKDLRIGRATRDGFVYEVRLGQEEKKLHRPRPKESAEWMFRVRDGNATRRGSKVDADWWTMRTDPACLAFSA